MSLRLVVFSLLALPASTTAQEPRPPEHFIMPLRADEIINDSAIGRTIIRGSIDWSNGSTTTSLEIQCDGSLRRLSVSDGRSVAEWVVEPDFCNFLAPSVQRRG
jgi:hypothetical protein